MGDGWRTAEVLRPGEECLPDKGSRSMAGCSLVGLGDLDDLDTLGDLAFLGVLGDFGMWREVV